MKLWFSKVTGMGISNSLRNTKLLGFSEGRVGWDGLSQSRLYLWPKGVVVLVFTKLTEDSAKPANLLVMLSNLSHPSEE